MEQERCWIQRQEDYSASDLVRSQISCGLDDMCGSKNGELSYFNQKHLNVWPPVFAMIFTGGKGESYIYTFICVFWCFVVLLINLRPRRSSLCTLSLNLSKEDSWCASSWITGKAHPAFSKSSFEERERAEWCGLTYSCDCVVRSVVGGEERPKIIG